MRHTKQQTIRREVHIEGIGLHSGKPASVFIKPALPSTGLVFVRTDLQDPVTIPATCEFVTQTKMATTLGRGKTHISTVEHLLSALKLLGIDNAMIEVNGPEVPIMDGSAAPFCELLLEAGIYEQAASRKVAVLKKKIEIRNGDKIAMIEPANRLHVRAKVEWSHPKIGAQDYSFTVDHSDFREIAMARTFGFLKDVEQLKAAGLALGGSLDNAVVLDETRILNPNGLRYSNEFARHKVLDAIGDLALAPMAILGDVHLFKAGHELHAELVAEIFSDPNNYEVKNAEDLSFVAETVIAGPSWVRA
jgi:UDP-3-O-[3-hydroxymyristoyl] N-acetylglucosamine deacetylase